MRKLRTKLSTTLRSPEEKGAARIYRAKKIRGLSK
jgi:hypothetical protein